MNNTEYQHQINDFEAHYHYDTTYMRELLESAPDGYAKFSALFPLSSHQEKLSIEDYWVAKLAAMQVEDCGACLQLSVRMALEAGVERDIVSAAVNLNGSLSDNLNDVFNYAQAVARQSSVEHAVMDRMVARYDKGMLLEFGLCIATAKVFPTIKRAVGYAESCSLIKIKV